MANNKTGFTSSFGVVMAAAGSAVGLGNIWRFPYICGQYGGAASLIVYLFFVFLIGMVLLMTEFVIGRRSGYAPEKAFPALAPKRPSWKLVGLFGMFTCFLILAIYLVISGWTLGYFWESMTGTLASIADDGFADHFASFAASTWKPVLFLVVFLVFTLLVILGGVQKGIEQVSKLLMPILLVLVIALCVRSLTLPGASKGIEYLFNPDFSKLTWEGILAILGQALFSLSVGMGAMIVYGSYIPRDNNILKNAAWITVCDVLIAVLAGVAIFPAVFAAGQSPAGGPSLVYEVLPIVFNSMGGIGIVFAALFFLLLSLAALTSAISLLETLTAWLHDRGMKRSVAAVLISSIELVLAVVVAYAYKRDGFDGGILSDFTPGGRNLFDWVDKLTGSYLPPIGALLTVIFFGWVMKKEDIYDELSNHGVLKISWFKVFYHFLIRFLAPAALFVALVAGIFNS
ncbi:MAG: sodium-dependent transporter [Bacteroidales bacterium]|nr:sodium-dependent transporter [Bacteroidales bacterium]